MDPTVFFLSPKVVKTILTPRVDPAFSCRILPCPNLYTCVLAPYGDATRRAWQSGEHSSFFFPPSFEVWNLYVCPYGESRLPLMFQTSFFTIFVFSNNLHEKASSADVKCPYKNTNFKRGWERKTTNIRRFPGLLGEVVKRKDPHLSSSKIDE
jgi:hypothetical protein